MTDAQPIRSVAILGAGLTGLSAAALFARALPQLAITIIDCPPDPAALADRMPGTLPSIHLFHDEIGVGPQELTATALALPRMGTRMRHWPSDGDTWFHSFGRTGRPLGTIPFHHVWLRAEAAGQAHAFHRYSHAARLAEAEQFDPSKADSAASTVEWGLSLDPEAYRALLIHRCAALGVRQFAAGLSEVKLRDARHIAALRLDDGHQVEADLFLDCAGPRARLLSRLSDTFENWTAWLPNGEAVLLRTDDRPSLCDEAIGSGSACQWRAPTPWGWVEFTFVDHPHPMGQIGERVTIHPGRRPRPWIGNVLALGEAACAVGPLHAANLHLAQSGARLAMALLPDRTFGALEVAEYNRRSHEETDRVRDFIALHHLAREHRLADAPPSLARTIEQFARRGRLPFYECETFSSDRWITALLNCGVRPELSDLIGGDHTFEAVQDLLAAVAP